MTRPLAGYCPIVPTPYTAYNEIDLDSLRRLTRYLIDNGAQGMSPNGGDSEARHLTEDERMRALDTISEANRGRIIVLAGCSAVTTQESARLCRHAQRAGAEGVFVMPPQNWEGSLATQDVTDDAMLAYYQTIADGLDIPIMVHATANMDVPFLRAVLERVPTVRYIKDDGMVYDSDFISGLTTEEAKKKVGEYLKENKMGGVVTRFHLQDWIFSRQHYWGEPIPIIHCEKCGMVPVPEEQLPVELPVVDSYEPSDDGRSPLSKIHQWVNVKCPNCGGDAQRETDTMPNWAGSSWYFLRYTDPKNSDTFASKELQKYWMPVDHYEGGPEHVTLHLLYSRFWHKFLFDQDLVTTPEPYDIRTIHGMVLGEGGVKMSKSLGNVISPDALIDEYGADVTRGYMMFMGPYEGDVEWSTETINGVKRFVSKYYDFLLKAWEGKIDKSGEKESKAVSRLVKRVENNILSFKFNTTISALMEFYNEFYQSKFSPEDIERLIITIAPVFPHIAEEVWNIIGHNYSVHMQEWPKVDKKILEDEFVDIPVQINGRVRGYISVGVSDSEEDVRNKISENDALKEHIGGGDIKKLIYIPKRIVNVVI